jgi:hypothetical protein
MDEITNIRVSYVPRKTRLPLIEYWKTVVAYSCKKKTEACYGERNSSCDKMKSFHG